MYIVNARMCFSLPTKSAAQRKINIYNRVLLIVLKTWFRSRSGDSLEHRIEKKCIEVYHTSTWLYLCLYRFGWIRFIGSWYCKSVLFIWYFAEQSCRTPDQLSGACIPLRQCDYLYRMLATRPLTNEIRVHLARSQCGYQNQSPYVRWSSSTRFTCTGVK